MVQKDMEKPTETVSDRCCQRRKCPRSRPRCRTPCRKFRQGRKTRNAFLNFLRAYRRKCCAKSVKEIATQGAKIWNRMSTKAKAPYYSMACGVRKRRRSCCKKKKKQRKSRACPGGCRKKRRKSSCRRRRRSSCRRKRRKSCCPKRRRKSRSCPRPPSCPQSPCG